jgi:hypothetical protein
MITQAGSLDEQGRPEPPLADDETATLLGSWSSSARLWRGSARGTGRGRTTGEVGASSMTLGGLLEHLAYVEDEWFSRSL